MRGTAMACVALAALSFGCTMRAGVGEGSGAKVRSKGLASGYVACNGFRPWDGNIVEAGILSNDGRWGNLASLDLWPVGGIGLSLVGARIKILPFEAGIGLLGYRPEAESYKSPRQTPSGQPSKIPNKPLKGEKLRFRALIDGTDTLKIRESELWYEHGGFMLPGRQSLVSGGSPGDEPTYVNHVPWKPQWGGDPADLYPQGGASSHYTDLDAGLPRRENNSIQVVPLAVRGKVSIKEHPTASNDFTLSIYIDDANPGGAEWYEFSVIW